MTVHVDITVLKGTNWILLAFYEKCIHEISFFFYQGHGSMLMFACTTTKLPLIVSVCLYGWVLQVKGPRHRKERQGKPGT
jgi:hypothetical protein